LAEEERDNAPAGPPELARIQGKTAWRTRCNVGHKEEIMKLITSLFAAVLTLSVAGVASAEPRDQREHRSQPTREVRERSAVQREHREAREATSTRSSRSSTLRQGKQLFYKICQRSPEACH
jgi:hypothetical protein